MVTQEARSTAGLMSFVECSPYFSYGNTSRKIEASQVKNKISLNAEERQRIAHFLQMLNV